MNMKSLAENVMNTGRAAWRRLAVILFMCCCIIAGTFSAAYGTYKGIEGVTQGTDGVHYAQNAPIANIYIDPDMMDFNKGANSDTVSYELLSGNTGFVFLTASEIDAKYPDSGRSSQLLNTPAYPADTKFLVYDESQNNASIITGKTGYMNTFSGDIARFTFKGAAVLPGNEAGNVVITYSNISFPMQNNFGRHADTSNFKAKIDGSYARFYTNPDSYIRTSGTLRDGKSLSDYWKYDAENDKGVYLGKGLYTVGVGPYLHTANNLVEDRMNAGSDYGFTTRNGLRLDVKVQITDKEGNVINEITGIRGRKETPRFFYSMRDIDVNRFNNSNFAQLYDSDNQNYYSETVRLDYGIDEDSEVYIPGPDDKYKYTDVFKDGEQIVFRAKKDVDPKGDTDPGTVYSGFTTVIDNRQGLGVTYWASGSASAKIRTWIFEGHTFYKLKSSTGTGGSIRTTTNGNKTEDGDLSDGGAILDSTTIEVPGGKTVKYRISPRDGYWLEKVTVDGSNVTLPAEVGDETTIILNEGESGKERKGKLKKLNNGEYIFTFPDTVADHEIHVDWGGEYYFEKVWVDEEGGYIDITANAYTFDGSTLSDKVAATTTFRVNRSDVEERTVNSDGTVTWLIKRTDLPIEPEPDDHDDDHHCPLYWFATEEPLEYFDTTYSNESALALKYYEAGEEITPDHPYSDDMLTVLNSQIKSKDDCAYISMKNINYGVITNSLKKVTVSVNKIIAGNYRNVNDEFEFTAEFTGLEANTSFYTVSGYTDGSGTQTSGSFTSDADGKATVTFRIKGAQTWKALDITPNSKVTIKEAGNDYIPEYSVKRNGVNIGSGSNSSEGRELSTGSIDLSRDVDATYTNTKSRAIPTGIAENRQTGSALLVVSFSVLILLETMIIMALKRKRAE